MIFWKNNRQKANKIKNDSTHKKEYVRMQNGTERRLNKCSIFLFSSSNTCNTNHFFQCPQENKKKITLKFITGDAIPLALLPTHTMNHWALMLIIMMQALKCPMMVCAMLTGIAFLSRTDDATLSWTQEKKKMISYVGKIFGQFYPCDCFTNMPIGT